MGGRAEKGDGMKKGGTIATKWYDLLSSAITSDVQR